MVLLGLSRSELTTHFLDNNRRDHANDCPKNLDFSPTLIALVDPFLLHKLLWKYEGIVLAGVSFPSPF